jgi:hypothetical protein
MRGETRACGFRRHRRDDIDATARARSASRRCACRATRART